jgi:hypothetical protein
MSDNNIYQNKSNIINYPSNNNSNINDSESQDNTGTIIKINMDEINKDYTKRRQFNISPIVRRTPNTKADIIIQKIYTNRKNVIKNYQNTSTDFRENIYSSNNRISERFNTSKNDNLYNCETNINNNNTLITSYTAPNVDENNDDSPNIKDTSSSDSSPDKSVTPLSDESINSEKRKRRYYRTTKLKKERIKPININEIEIPKTTPSSSPRDITQDLWNDSVENYYMEFQKLCKDEAIKYKYLSHRNEIISNLLKFILLISGCFTFTLSISIPNSLFMSATTTISSCLTAIITSLSGFFQFGKKSEIQNNIYRELDKLYNIISLDMLKPTYMRPDPYEYILTLRNRKDELLKTLHKK